LPVPLVPGLLPAVPPAPVPPAPGPLPPLPEPAALDVPAEGWILIGGSDSTPPELQAKLAAATPDATRRQESVRDFSIVGPLEQNSESNTGWG
jgi:hypothetical protein